MTVGIEVMHGNKKYRVIDGQRAQVARWNTWYCRYDWTDVKTEATRLKIVELAKRVS